MTNLTVSDVRLYDTEGHGLVIFSDGTEITFTPYVHPFNPNRDYLETIEVKYENAEVARLTGRFRQGYPGIKPPFEHISHPATPKLVGQYCLAAQKHLVCSPGDPMWDLYRFVHFGNLVYHDMLRG